MNDSAWSDELTTDNGHQPPAATDHLGGERWLGRIAGLALRIGGVGADPQQPRARAQVRVDPANLVVIVLVSNWHVSATIAALHPSHGDKVVAHKTIDCLWHELSEAGKREAVGDAVRLACDSAGVEAYSVYLSVSDSSLSSRLAVGWADPGDEMVLGEPEYHWSLKRARDQATGADHELIDAIPVQWTVRSRAGEREVENPVGERGSRLTCQALLVTARRGYRAELASLVAGLDIELEGIIAQPVALYRGMSSSLPKKGSTLVIDCGARCTTFLVRRREKLMHIETHPFGGDDLTAALSARLDLSIAQAEDLKRDLDISMPARPEANLVGQQFIWGDVRERHRLVGPGAAICAELTGNFFRARAQELRENGYLGQQGQVHLVGRASSLGGLAMFLKEVLDLPVVLGTGQKNRDPSAELADILVSGLVCTAADSRRRRIAAQESRLRKTASGVWSWLTHPLA
jgi:cell division protein FtsA